MATPRAVPEQVVEPKAGVSVRAVGVGLVLAVGVNAFMLYTEYAVGASASNYSHFPVYVFASFALLILFVLPVLKRATGRAVLSRAEVYVVLMMGLVAGAVPANGLAGFLVVVMATPFYFATPENRWAEVLHPHIPAWIAPPHPETVRGFFEGLPPGASIPWSAWAVPLFWWTCFVVALAGIAASVAVLLRRQWAQNERLTYPLVSVAVDLAGGAEGISGLLKKRGFWIGFGLAFGLVAWNIVGYFEPSFPTIPLEGRSFPLGRGIPSIQTKINLFVVGFAYFANLDVLFSIWFFRLIYIAQVGIFNRLGYGSGGNEDQWSSGYAGWQSFGALIAMVLWGMWVARGHLREVLREACSPQEDADSGKEMMSYRAALIVLGVCSAFCVAWLWRAGMDISMVLAYGAASLVLYIGIARIVAESGLLYVRGPMTAQVFGLYMLGSSAAGPATVAALGLTYTTISQGKGLFLPALVQAARLADFSKGSRRRMLGAVALAFAVALITSVAVTLYLGYTYGTHNFRTWHIRAGGLWVFNDTAGKILSPFPADVRRLGFLGLGAGVMGLLTMLRYRFAWWPLHPIGFTVSCTYFTQRTFVAVFLAWACKLLILRLGGVTLYRRAGPVFLGLLVGYALGVALSALVDVFWFPGQGHYIHSV
ncbi:MAG: hypothetical protein O2954_17065 [bacterium]|nr:hypothetical protein [bacterium]